MLFLPGLPWCHKFQLHFMSLMPQIKGTLIKIDRFKMKPCPSQKKMTRLRGSNITQYFFHTLSCTEFDPCLIRISLLVTGLSPPIFGLQHCCHFLKRMQLNMGGLRLNTLFLYFLFHHLYLYFLFFFFNFPSFCNLYLSFFYFLLQPMLILTGLSWCHKFQLHFMSLMPKVKGTFIKIDCFKIKQCPSQKKMRRVRESNLT